MTDAATRRHTFATTPRMSTYLVALIAGPVRASGATPTPTSTARSRWACSAASRWPSSWTPNGFFTETKQGFGFYHRNFGVPYPFGKYDQLFVPEFNAGAMENAGAVTFLEDYVFRSKVTRASTSGAPRRCCTRWRTCGSATWSP